MKCFPHAKLLRIHELRLDVALNAVQNQQEIVKTHDDHCEAIERKLAALQLDRKCQQERMASSGQLKLVATLLVQRERSIHLNTDRHEQARDELGVAQQARNEARDVLAVELGKYHRTRAKRDRLCEREKDWQRGQLRSVASTEDQELSEFALAQCTAVR